MSSVAGPKKGPINRAVYGASKAAVVGLTKAVAADYVTQGIRCNAICPGTVDSPSLHDRLRATGDYDAALKAFIARQAMGRLGRADEIAALVCYLASDESGLHHRNRACDRRRLDDVTDGHGIPRAPGLTRGLTLQLAPVVGRGPGSSPGRGR
jgi:NAD(P)-dependent dehydrogenase (short-subunit alcohol dehydrogenase family)